MDFSFFFFRILRWDFHGNFMTLGGMEKRHSLPRFKVVPAILTTDLFHIIFFGGVQRRLQSINIHNVVLHS